MGLGIILIFSTYISAFSNFFYNNKRYFYKNIIRA